MCMLMLKFDAVLLLVCIIIDDNCYFEMCIIQTMEKLEYAIPYIKNKTIQ